jgi:hypothetical protein
MLLRKSLKNKRVLVIGDSFTDILGTNTTWLSQLKTHYNWEIDNLSVSGAGSHYAWHTFLDYKKSFDVCIFAWSEPSRFYVPGIPYLNSSEATNMTRMLHWQKNIYKAAQHYYAFLQNLEFDSLRNTAMLFWLDHYLSENYKDKKFIHFHCFPNINSQFIQNKYLDVYELVKTANDNSFYHTFKTGINASPTLLKLSSLDKDAPKDYGIDPRSGHFGQDMHNKIFYNLINYFNENEYKNGDIIDLNR